MLLRSFCLLCSLLGILIHHIWVHFLKSTLFILQRTFSFLGYLISSWKRLDSQETTIIAGVKVATLVNFFVRNFLKLNKAVSCPQLALVYTHLNTAYNHLTLKQYNNILQTR